MSYGGQQNRTEWYDRAPLLVQRLFAQTIAPAGLTARWSYTVPASRKCLVENAIAIQTRITAAGAGGYCASFIGDGAAYVVAAIGYQFTSAGMQQTGALAGAMVYLAGSTITGQTWDTSTGGTVEYLVSMKATEYDA